MEKKQVQDCVAAVELAYAEFEEAKVDRDERIKAAFDQIPGLTKTSMKNIKKLAKAKVAEKVDELTEEAIDLTDIIEVTVGKQMSLFEKKEAA